ncbi:hypothetical protein EYF80_035762 [Liparis tanakae]|uniref:Uncharacterized protein n=1 Tax=Liparis tanakae TaxID=230148 RepID=A0A4Z2GKC3_9TELE|nr:hypothetical protein EYF80_035762 [Liparis tanakae]
MPWRRGSFSDQATAGIAGSCQARRLIDGLQGLGLVDGQKAGMAGRWKSEALEGKDVVFIIQLDFEAVSGRGEMPHSRAAVNTDQEPRLVVGRSGADQGFRLSQDSSETVTVGGEKRVNNASGLVLLQY